tara:strand:+ start:237 stop:959 length:723 start_codon:yes stop_codon:yes gene_type:complete
MIVCIIGVLVLIICIWMVYNDYRPRPIHIKSNSALVSHKYQGDKRFYPVDVDNAEMYLINNFLSRQECDDIISICQFNPSTTVSDASEKVVDIVHPNRTSWSCFFEKTMKHPYYLHIENKMKQYLKWEPHSEAMQAQRYKENQHYLYHYDFFQENSDHVTKGSGQRTYTFMVYLTDVKEGGDTDFEVLGVRVKPKRGLAVVWNNLYNNGKPNQHMRHAGLPPRNGASKIILTKWFRQRST